METFTREKLHELVWSEPVTKLAARFGVSDVALAKRCRRANVPVPPRGYWAKLAAGRSVARVPLPPATATDPKVIALGRPTEHPLPMDPVQEPDDPKQPTLEPPTFAEDLSDFAARVRASVKKVTVRPISHRAHPLVAEVLAYFEEQYLRPQWPWGYRDLDIRFERRRLKILNALFLALEREGASPKVCDQRARDLTATVAGTVVPLVLDSQARFRRGRGRHSDPKKLELRIAPHDKIADHLGAWDEREGLLDSQLVEIVSGILIAGEGLRREQELKRYRDALAFREWIAAEKRREQERREQARIGGLLQEAAAYRRASDLRAYVDAARADHEARSDGNAGTFESWEAWARGIADSIDPLSSRREGAPADHVSPGLDVQHPRTMRTSGHPPRGDELMVCSGPQASTSERFGARDSSQRSSKLSGRIRCRCRPK